MKFFKRVVAVDLKPSLLDPEGDAISSVLRHMGFPVTSVRVGRRIQLTVAAATSADADAVCRQMGEQLLANPVMESFRVEPSGEEGELPDGPAGGSSRP
jgi:phosphoribosylformylglycinamidine synthase PurS subunit